MKTLSIISAACGIAFMGAASAANITIYYSPTCPHCHHARDFINNNLKLVLKWFNLSFVLHCLKAFMCFLFKKKLMVHETWTIN